MPAGDQYRLWSFSSLHPSWGESAGSSFAGRRSGDIARSRPRTRVAAEVVMSARLWKNDNGRSRLRGLSRRPPKAVAEHKPCGQGTPGLLESEIPVRPSRRQPQQAMKDAEASAERAWPTNYKSAPPRSPQSRLRRSASGVRRRRNDDCDARPADAQLKLAT